MQHQSPLHAAAGCSVKELQALEEAAWASPELRQLYATRHIPGFPWHTVDVPATSSAPLQSARRHVIPYDYPFTVFVKGRWVGRRLLDVYAEELPHHAPAYYEACLHTGRLYCVQRGTLKRHNTQRKLLKRAVAPASNSSPASHPEAQLPATTTTTTTTTQTALLDASAAATSPTTKTSANTLEGLNVVLQHGDVVYHTVHRHEVPVSVGATGMDSVHITAVRIARYGLLCVNKPTGLPTHATGRYMYNSLTMLLEYVLAPKRLHAWLIAEDVLLQSLVSTKGLSDEEKKELYDYYSLPPLAVDSRATTSTTDSDSINGEISEVDPDKIPRPCHRLDKVTSGVLLLAVRQDAAKRIGAVLSQKAKEVDEAVSAELTTGATLRSGGTHAHDLLASPAFQRIVGRTYELQKYYVARVVGALTCEKRNAERGCSAVAAGASRDAENESRTSASSTMISDTVWPLSGTEACVQQHNRAVHGLLASAASVLNAANLTPVAGKHPEVLSCVFPGGVLTTAPIQAQGHAAAVADNSSDRAASRAGVCAFPTAATLCQTIGTATAAQLTQDSSSFSGVAAPADVESVVLCTPYTGRLHQIRYHLSSLGCPIVGDVTYRTPTCAEGVEGASVDRASPTSAEIASAVGVAQKIWTRNERDYVYFDPGQLPAAYRSFCKARERQSLMTEEAAPLAIGTKRDRADADLQSTTVSPPAWKDEPSCYECAGRLPIVATKECATGTSAVCLHAWAYDMRESLLLQPPASRACTAAISTVDRSCEVNVAQSSLGDLAEAGVSGQTGGARVVRGGFVRFEAPLPAWAFSTSSIGRESCL